MTQAHITLTEKSTNDRSFYWYLSPLRGAFRFLAALAPETAAKVALRLFRTPFRHKAPAREQAWMDSAESFEIQIGGQPITYWTWGHGPAVLLAHGWEGRGSQMAAFAQPLVKAGFQVVTFDGPAHGRSGGRRSSVPQHAEAIAVLAEKVGPLHAVVGHSFGTAAAGWAAQKVHLADRLVFIAPPGDLDEYVEFFAGLLGVSSEVRSRFLAQMESRFDLKWNDVRYATMTPVEQVDLLVIQDRHDRESPFKNGVAVAQAWPGSRLVTTAGLGHRRILRNPSVISEVLTFLSQENQIESVGKATRSAA